MDGRGTICSNGTVGPELHENPELAAAAWSARVEWRADEEEWTAAAFEKWSHDRTLLDRATEHLHRGDVLAVALPGGGACRGRVVGVGADVVALDTAGGRVDVHVGDAPAIAWRVVERADNGGTRGVELTSFRARLVELEGDAAVEVGVAHFDGVARGALTVGRDHLSLDDDGVTTVLGLAAVDWVRAGR
jgi:hypothetical protein